MKLPSALRELMGTNSSEPSDQSGVDGDDAPPNRRQFPELAWNMARLLATFRKRGPRGPADGPPVLVIPGFLCQRPDDFTLRRALARAGYRVHGWKNGMEPGGEARHSRSSSRAD